MRLIDADELNKVKFHKLPYTHIVPADLPKLQTEAYERGWNDAIDAIMESAPTVDAVSVIRCRECEFAHMTFGGECKYCDAWADDEYLYLDGDFFCAFGKRRDEDDETD